MFGTHPDYTEQLLVQLNATISPTALCHAINYCAAPGVIHPQPPTPPPPPPPHPTPKPHRELLSTSQQERRQQEREHRHTLEFEACLLVAAQHPTQPSTATLTAACEQLHRSAQSIVRLGGGHRRCPSSGVRQTLTPPVTVA